MAARNRLSQGRSEAAARMLSAGMSRPQVARLLGVAPRSLPATSGSTGMQSQHLGRCGTAAGYQRHLAAGTSPCSSCLRAAGTSTVARLQRRGSPAEAEQPGARAPRPGPHDVIPEGG